MRHDNKPAKLGVEKPNLVWTTPTGAKRSPSGYLKGSSIKLLIFSLQTRSTKQLCRRPVKSTAREMTGKTVTGEFDKRNTTEENANRGNFGTPWSCHT